MITRPYHRGRVYSFQYRRLIVYRRMMAYCAAAAPLIKRLKLKDRDLADQIERGGNSMVSNLGEGASEDRPKVKADRYRITKREAEECGINWEKAVTSRL